VWGEAGLDPPFIGGESRGRLRWWGRRARTGGHECPVGLDGAVSGEEARRHGSASALAHLCTLVEGRGSGAGDCGGGGAAAMREKPTGWR
jgi:hypothetical protein